MNPVSASTWFGPMSFCRQDDLLVSGIDRTNRVIASACVNIVVATTLYGFVFGLWRAPLQACYSAVKMPLLFFSVVLASALVNTMLAQAIGMPLSLRRVTAWMLTGMTVTAVVMASLAPVMLFFVLQVPGPGSHPVGLPPDAPELRGAMLAYRPLLLAHVAVIAFAGIVGNVRLYRLMRAELGSAAKAARLLGVWLLIVGFVGGQLSWLFSPFLCHPGHEPHIIARFYFKYNFYEYVWMSLRGLW